MDITSTGQYLPGQQSSYQPDMVFLLEPALQQLLILVGGDQLSLPHPSHFHSLAGGFEANIFHLHLRSLPLPDNPCLLFNLHSTRRTTPVQDVRDVHTEVRVRLEI